MKINPHKGFYLAFEGLDGSGSDQVASSVAKVLAKEGYSVVFTKEPTKGQIGRFIKKLIKERGEVSPLTLTYLFAADRSIQNEDKIIPSLKEGKIVISDRCLWSSIAYQGLFFHTHWLLEVNGEFLLPDNTYFVDRSAYECANNIRRDENGIAIYESEAKLSQIREGYQWIGQKFSYCFDFVDPEEFPDISQEIIKRAKKHPKFPKK